MREQYADSSYEGLDIIDYLSMRSLEEALQGSTIAIMGSYDRNTYGDHVPWVIENEHASERLIQHLSQGNNLIAISHLDRNSNQDHPLLGDDLVEFPWLFKDILRLIERAVQRSPEQEEQLLAAAKKHLRFGLLPLPPGGGEEFAYRFVQPQHTYVLSGRRNPSHVEEEVQPIDHHKTKRIGNHQMALDRKLLLMRRSHYNESEVIHQGVSKGIANPIRDERVQEATEFLESHSDQMTMYKLADDIASISELLARMTGASPRPLLQKI